MQPSSMARMLLWWKDLPHSLRRPARSKLRTGRPVVYAVRDFGSVRKGEPDKDSKCREPGKIDRH